MPTRKPLKDEADEIRKKATALGVTIHINLNPEEDVTRLVIRGKANASTTEHIENPFGEFATGNEPSTPPIWVR